MKNCRPPKSAERANVKVRRLELESEERPTFAASESEKSDKNCVRRYQTIRELTAVHDSREKVENMCRIPLFVILPVLLSQVRLRL